MLTEVSLFKKKCKSMKKVIDTHKIGARV